MPDDKTLKLKIELDGSITPGAREAQEQLATAAADVAKEMGVVTVTSIEAEKTLKQTGATVKTTGDQAHEGGEGLKEFNLHGREMHHLAGLLNRILPGSGEALKGVAESGEEGAMLMIGLVSVVEAVSKSFEELTRNAEAADAALAAIIDEKYDADATLKVAEAWNSATIAHEIYLRSLAEHVEDDNDPSKGPVERAGRAAQAWQTAQQKIDEAQKKLGMAAIDEYEKRGLLTHQQALNAKLQLDAQYEQRRLALAVEADAHELGLKQKTADIVKSQKAAATTAEAGAEQSSATADASKAHIEQEINKTKADQAAATAEMTGSGVTSGDARNIREYYEQASGQSSNGKSLNEMGDWLRTLVNNPLNPGNDVKLAGLGMEGVNDLRSMFTSYVTGGRDLSDAQLSAFGGGEDVEKKSTAALVKLNAQLAIRDHDAAIAKAELERQKKLLEEKTAQLDKLQQEIDELKARQQAQEANDATVAGIDAQTAAIKAGRFPVNPFAPPPPAAAAPPPPDAPSPETAQIQAMIDAIQHGQGTQAIAIANALQQSHHLSNLNTLNLIGLIEQAVRDHQANAARIAQIEAQIFGGRTTGVPNG